MNSYFSPDAEVALLSILIRHPETYYELSGVNRSMFNSTPNQLLFESITELNSQASTPEHTLLRNYLEAKNQLKEAGGDEYLSYLVGQSFDSSNVKEYESLVVGSFKARRLSELNKELNGFLTSGSPVDDVISKIRSDLDNLTAVVAGNQTSNIRDLTRATLEEVQRRARTPGVPGLTTGYSSIDLVTAGINAGDLWIIAARPSMGKTSLMCNMALKSADAGNGVVIFSLEMTKQVLVERLLSIDSGVDFSDIRFGFLDNNKLGRIKSSLEKLQTMPIFIDSNYLCTPEYITGTIRKLNKHNNTKIVFVDYVQLLAERTVNSTHELGAISRSAKLLANDLGIGFILLSQLNRGVEMREDKRPVLSDLRQSGNLEEDADLVSFLYRDEYYNKDTPHKGTIEFIIRKARNSYIGTLPLYFTPNSTSIEERK